MSNQNQNHNDIIEIFKKNSDNFSTRTIDFLNNTITIIYIKELTDRQSLSQFIVKPLIDAEYNSRLNAQTVLNNIIYLDDCKIKSEKNEIESFIMTGFTVILFSDSTDYLVANVKTVPHRSIPDPEFNYVLRGPRECFIEHLDTNISLIRYRLKNKNLRISYHTVGARSKSRVAVVYFEDIANNHAVTQIKQRIDSIDIDGILESGELQSFLLNHKLNLFPQMGIVERVDMACDAMLEGKITIYIEGSGIALIAPKTFREFLWSCEDMYDNKYIGFFLRILRIISLILTSIISSLYIATVAFHSDLLPSQYIIMIAQTRSQVPFNAFIEVMIIEIIVELLREALLRVPSKYGTAIGIVGAIIIGDAAITAGIFSPLLLIVVALSLICSFIPSDFTLVNPFRIIKFFLIILTAVFGFFGLVLGITFVLAHLVSINSFGVPYFAPVTPFIRKDAIKSVFYNKALAKKRPYFLNLKDATRTSDPPNTD